MPYDVNISLLMLRII